MRGKGGVLISAAMIFALSPLSAVGDTVSSSDPQGDNSGRGFGGQTVAARLDFSEVTHEHLPQGYQQEDLLVHRAETFDEWGNDLLDDPQVTLSFRFIHDVGETNVSIGVNDDGTLYGKTTFYSYRQGQSDESSFARVWRPNDRSIAVAVTRGQIWPHHGDDLVSYDWTARSDDRSCSNQFGDVIVYCFDVAPDPDPMHHVIEGPGSLDCQDGVDNDGDGVADYPEDTGCDSAEDYFEGLTEDCPGCDEPKLTIRERATFPELHGRLRSPHEACEQDRWVYLYRERPGEDRWVYRIGVEGRWGMPLPTRAGRYYVLVRRVTTEWLEESVKCSEVASRTIRL